MVLTTAGISARGRSRQGAEVPKSIKNRKLENVTCKCIGICRFKFSIFNFQHCFLMKGVHHGETSRRNIDGKRF